jgi:hypothetical protein
MRRSCIPSIALLCISVPGFADESKAPREPQMEIVLVTGEQPGPALWKVSSAGHVLWILGEVSPVPRRMKWRSKQFERRLAESQEVLLESEQVSNTCKQQRATESSRPQDLPGTLKDLVSPQLYSRVETVSDIYGERAKLEKLPALAATTHLYNIVPFSLNLRTFGAAATVSILARKAEVAVTSIPLPCLPAEEKERAYEYPVACLERVLDLLEDGGGGLRRLANAWAVGDIGALRPLVPAYAVVNETHQPGKCAVAASGELRAQNFVARKTESWLSEAERALQKNPSTMAVVPIAELFAPDGYLAGLRAKGYEVEEPSD